MDTVLPDEPFDDPTLIMEVLAGIREDVRYVIRLWRTTMGKKWKRTPEQRAAWEAQVDDQLRRLRAAIARRKALLVDQQRTEGG